MKSFMHVENLYTAINLILEERPKGQVYNCGPDEAISMSNLVREICVVTEKNYEECVHITEGRSFEDSIYWLNSGKIKNELGWKQTISLQTGLIRMYEWVKKYRDKLEKADISFELRA